MYMPRKDRTENKKETTPSRPIEGIIKQILCEPNYESTPLTDEELAQLQRVLEKETARRARVKKCEEEIKYLKDYFGLQEPNSYNENMKIKIKQTYTYTGDGDAEPEEITDEVTIADEHTVELLFKAFKALAAIREQELKDLGEIE